MQKLFRLKKWLTVPDAARHLTTMFEEPVSEADILRLGLDGHLTLSVNLVNGAMARKGTVVPIENAPITYFPTELRPKGSPDWVPIRRIRRCDPLPADLQHDLEQGKVHGAVVGVRLDETRILELAKDVSSIRGVWDLPMIGAETIDVEHMYQQLTGGPEVTLTCLEGTFVKSSDGTPAQLQARFDEPEMIAMQKEITERLQKSGVKLRSRNEKPKRPYNDPENYYPAGGLPADAPLVVRTEALSHLMERMQAGLSSQANTGNLTPGERKTLDILAAYLGRKFGYDPDAKKNDATGKISRELETHGLNLDEKTVRGLLKRGATRFPRNE